MGKITIMLIALIIVSIFVYTYFSLSEVEENDKSPFRVYPEISLYTSNNNIYV